MLVAWHDVLLFLLAYPESPAMLDAAARELARVAATAQAIDAAGRARERARLRGSGIAWSTTTVAFSLPIVEWLLERHPEAAEIDSFPERGDLLVPLLGQALPPAEFALVEAAEGAPAAAIDAGTEGWRRSRLAWLAERVRQLPCERTLVAALYDGFAPFVALAPRDAPISRTFARGLAGATHYHREPLLREVDVPRAIAEALPAPRRLQAGERRRLLDAARGVLAMHGRETDPVTHADAGATRWHELGRGLAIALYSARPEWRPPLDSHIGYMLFKNSIPIAYGGGWPFLGTCRIGVNVFAAFRGGESTFVMASILRVYAQLFAVERFVVEPYQFGAGNREGLQSGAFWFYHRLGFRPVDSRVRELAASELERMQRDSGYRSPLATLKRFTRSDLELVVAPGSVRACDPADLSRATTAWIGERFGGDRERAVAFAVERLSEALAPVGTGRWNACERRALAALAPVLAQIDGIERWPLRDRRRLAALVRAKGGDEFRYFEAMADFPRLRAGLNGVAARAGFAEPPPVHGGAAAGTADSTSRSLPLRGSGMGAALSR